MALYCGGWRKAERVMTGDAAETQRISTTKNNKHKLAFFPRDTFTGKRRRSSGGGKNTCAGWPSQRQAHIYTRVLPGVLMLATFQLHV